MARRAPTAASKALTKLPETLKAALAPLDPRQQKFVLAYVGEANSNGRLAAEMAGYKKAGAQTQASWMLTLPLVRAAIDAWLQEYAMGPIEATARLADLAKCHMGPFTKVNPVTNDLEYEVTAENWEKYKHWVKAIQVDEQGRVVRLVLHDAQVALTTMAKILKLFSDAPHVTFKLYLQNKTDEELLQEVEEERRRLRSTAYLGRN